MWPFSRRKKKDQEEPKESAITNRPTNGRRRAIKRLIVGFIIGGAITSIVGKGLIKKKKSEHLGVDEDKLE